MGLILETVLIGYALSEQASYPTCIFICVTSACLKRVLLTNFLLGIIAAWASLRTSLYLYISTNLITKELCSQTSLPSRFHRILSGNHAKTPKSIKQTIRTIASSAFFKFICLLQTYNLQIVKRSSLVKKYIKSE